MTHRHQLYVCQMHQSHNTLNNNASRPLTISSMPIRILYLTDDLEHIHWARLSGIVVQVVHYLLRRRTSKIREAAKTREIAIG
ncbi:hypothetical protein RRF57_005685 [Xylaria bambusicola]|uniref:Uncharacterized protein n=1 Tax=Xylaria bambusicola TaxID=326684 RepID=A0AAN7UD17_9PEZI